MLSATDEQLPDALSAESMLAEDMGKFAWDPLGFVRYAFAWGEGELAQHPGPDDVQVEILEELGRMVRARNFNGTDPVKAIRMARASGHGIGKSALTGMLVAWIMSTRPHSKGIVTANTGEQLETKTWAEIVKWMGRCITSHWFEVSLGGMFVRHKQHPETWRCDAVTWNLRAPEAFAGLHAAHSSPFYIFDEASAIPDKIFEVAEGGLTDGEPFEILWGNPTRSSGFFYDCFHKNRHLWNVDQIDSRRSRFTNKAQIEEWIETHGIDSDFVRVRVLGQFPKASSKQFIATDLITAARSAQVVANWWDPVVLGVDVARYGLDESVIAIRKGRDARTHAWWSGRSLDTMQLVGEVSRTVHEMNAQGIRIERIFVDVVGIGAGVFDRLAQLGYPVSPVNFGETPVFEQGLFANRGTECWAELRDWLKAGAAIPDDDVLADQLRVREYTFTPMNKQQLEPKDRLKERGQESPDRADALALTFAEKLAPLARPHEQAAPAAMSTPDYDPLGRE